MVDAVPVSGAQVWPAIVTWWQLGLAGLGLAILVAAGCAGSTTVDDLIVRDAWVREAAADQPNTAAYFVVENRGATAVALTAVRAQTAAAAELHATRMSSGMMTMTRVDDVPVPARGVVELRPGGYHVMLFGLTAPLDEGQTTELTLEFTGGLTRTVTARVGGRSAVGHGPH